MTALPRQLVVLWVGRQRRDSWSALCGEYLERIGRFVRVRETVVRSGRSSDDAERLREEGRALLDAVKRPGVLIALDRQGRELSSRRWSRELGRLLDAQPHPVFFAVGGDLGLSAEVLAAADDRWSLGPLTLPHSLARLLLIEQLYRALSLRAGIKYHREPF